MSQPIWIRAVCVGVCLIGLVGGASSQERGVTLETAIDPGPNSVDEPLAREYSRDRALRFLDSAALTWQRDRKCFTCHTNFAYLYARPLAGGDAPALAEVRGFADELVRQRWQEQGPRWDAEVVAAAAALAFHDANTTGELRETTRTALDRMWTTQREDGGWKWLDCKWPPMEMDDHYGVTLAALAVGNAPGGYADSDSARAGVEGIRRYLQANPGETLHQRAMVVWASMRLEGLLTDEQRGATVDELLALQRPDGGWALAGLGNWEREDGSPQDRETSDGYGTGFVVFVLRQAGVPSKDPRIQRGVEWLKGHQRESGRWFTRSLKKDGRHFITHAGTAFAVMALSVCEPPADGRSSQVR